MARPTGRPRPLYEPDRHIFQRLMDQAGMGIVDYARDLGCGETTLRKLLAGEKVVAETLRVVADKLKTHWHSLLSEAERKRIGVDQPAPGAPLPGPTPSASPLMPALSSRLFQLPAVLPDFTGRESQITELTGHLRGHHESLRQFVLHGMGGIGKSSLAIRVAYEMRDHFPDAQLFLDLRGAADATRGSPLAPAEAMARIIRALQPEVAQLPSDEQELEGYYRSVLVGKRALIVLDNARSESQVRALLTAAPSVSFLLTSRTALALDGVRAVQVELLSKDASVQLLRRIIGEKGLRAEVQRIVDLCGYLPLAIRVAGDFLRLKDDWSIPRYIDALNEQRLRWLKVGTDPAKDVEAVLKLSSAQYVQDHLERATRWHLLHIFQGDFTLAAAAAAWDADEHDHNVLDDLSDMRNRSLIIFDAKTGRYHLHDLMRPIAEGLFG